MGFHDVQLDTKVSWGFEGGPGYNTVVQATASGHEERIARWAKPRRRYRGTKALMGTAEAATLLSFFVERRGSLHGFRFKDWQDFCSDSTGQTPTAVSGTDQLIGSGDGTTKVFQLCKTYGSVNPDVRKIKLPVDGTLVVTIDGTPTAAWTCDYATGLVTFNSAPAVAEVIRAGFEFDVPVRFGQGLDAWLNLTAAAYGRVDLAQFEVIEILDEEQFADSWDPGGSVVLATAVDFTMSCKTRVWWIDAQAAINGFLPIPTHLPGGEYFRVVVIAGSVGNLTIRDDSGTVVESGIAAGEQRVILLVDDGSTKTWWSG